MDINVNKLSVYEYAASIAARIAASSEDYTNVAITSDNYPLLDVHLSAAIADAEGELRKHLKKSHSVNMLIEEDTIILSLRDIHRLDTSIQGVVESSLRLFLANYICGEWLLTTEAKEYGSTIAQGAAQYINKIISALNQRDVLVIDEADFATPNADNTTEGGNKDSFIYATPNADNTTEGGNKDSFIYATPNADNTTEGGKGPSSGIEYGPKQEDDNCSMNDEGVFAVDDFTAPNKDNTIARDCVLRNSEGKDVPTKYPYKTENIY